MEGGLCGESSDKSYQRFFGVSSFDQRLGSACALVNLCSMKIIGNETTVYSIV